MLRLRYTAVSDVGRVRKDNQDSGYAGPHLLAVADGVGGSARGDVASSAAIAELKALDVEPPQGPDDADLTRTVAATIDAAHRRIGDLTEQYPELETTSTTVTLAVFDGARLAIGHVGDSRGYLLRDGEITRLTTDHTFVQSLIDEGRITEEESRVHPHRNLILRAVDGVHESEPDLFFVDVRAGDRIMLCSDGASGALDDAALALVLGQGTVEKAAQDLVRESLEAGSTDNVTVVAADVIDTAAEDPDETQAIAVGPVVVGAAAERRKGLSRRRPRKADTGELEAVPAAADGGPAPHGIVTDPETIRYAPRAPHRFAWLGRLVVILIVVAVLYVAATAAYRWSQKQYFIKPAAGYVAIYQGVPADLPVVSLHHVLQRSDTLVADLPSYYRGQVRNGMSADSLADARALLRRLEGQADCSSAATTTPSATPTPTATPTPGAATGPSTSPATSPSVSPTTSPTTPAC
ncbi:serine/threonine-protein phosphatase [Nocardioides mangrovicus]|uniref:Serine/threonine-protein phosphatase n=1 Tax=Nocardioides mangrovicus TaxID=2478913 RepID=A0A3L8P0U8_9ACTN|nr:serine/threonine-protein phosphatase [Nocardioides mangrovicus]